MAGNRLCPRGSRPAADCRPVGLSHVRCSRATAVQQPRLATRVVVTTCKLRQGASASSSAGRRSGCSRGRLAVAASWSASPALPPLAASPQPHGVQWWLAVMATDAGKNPIFSLQQVGAVMGAQVAVAFVAALGLRRLCSLLAARAGKKVEEKFGIDPENMPEDGEGSKVDSWRLNNTAIAMLSGAFALDRIGQLFVPLAALFSLHKIADFTEDVMAMRGEAVSDWVSGPVSNVLSHAVSIEEWIYVRAAAICLMAVGTLFVIEFKNRAVDLILKRQKWGQERYTALMKMMKPLSSLATFVLVVVGVLNAALVCGVDVRKYLLAIGSVSGLAVGFGAQSLVSSVLSGVNLFLTVPFLVGDRVELRSSGQPVLIGVVEGLKLCSTVFRLDSGLPVEVPNSALTTMMICNHARTKDPDRDNYRDPRAFSMTATVEIPGGRVNHWNESEGCWTLSEQAGTEEMSSRVPALVEAISEVLENMSTADNEIPTNCRLQSFSGANTAVLDILAHSASEADYDDFSTEVMIKVARVIERQRCVCQGLTPHET